MDSTASTVTAICLPSGERTANASAGSNGMLITCRPRASAQDDGSPETGLADPTRREARLEATLERLQACSSAWIRWCRVHIVIGYTPTTSRLRPLENVTTYGGQSDRGQSVCGAVSLCGDTP